MEVLITVLNDLSSSDDTTEPITNTETTSSVTYSSRPPKTTTRAGSNNQDPSLADSYKMAAEVAVGAAIIVALAILLALIWNTLKRRLPNANNVDDLPSSSRRRYSVDSLERLVEERLRNRPPPYTMDQDKPPTYEDSFLDPSSRHSSPRASESRRTRNADRPSPPRHQATETSRGHHVSDPLPPSYQPTTLPPYRPQQQPTPVHLHGQSTVISRVVSYNNRAFDGDGENESEPELCPSISMAVDHQQMSATSGQLENTDEDVIMLHL